MDDFSKCIEQLTQKANNITDFCNISCNEEMKGKLLGIESELRSVWNLLEDAKKVLKEHPSTMRAMRAALHELRRQEVIMKLVLETSDSPKKTKQPQNDYLVSRRSCVLIQYVI